MLKRPAAKTPDRLFLYVCVCQFSSASSSNLANTHIQRMPLTETLLPDHNRLLRLFRFHYSRKHFFIVFFSGSNIKKMSQKSFCMPLETKRCPITIILSEKKNHEHCTLKPFVIFPEFQVRIEFHNIDSDVRRQNESGASQKCVRVFAYSIFHLRTNERERAIKDLDVETSTPSPSLQPSQLMRCGTVQSATNHNISLLRCGNHLQCLFEHNWHLHVIWIDVSIVVNSICLLVVSWIVCAFLSLYLCPIEREKKRIFPQCQFVWMYQEAKISYFSNQFHSSKQKIVFYREQKREPAPPYLTFNSQRLWVVCVCVWTEQSCEWHTHMKIAY